MNLFLLIDLVDTFSSKRMQGIKIAKNTVFPCLDFFFSDLNLPTKRFK